MPSFIIVLLIDSHHYQGDDKRAKWQHLSMECPLSQANSIKETGLIDS
jgi:hypothetical protein